MKYKKYIILLLLVVVFGCNKAYASTNFELNTINSSLSPIVEKVNLINFLDVDCSGLFGDRNDPDSLSYLINEILQYPKIIVPILVIGLGTLDLVKAVIAGKEDDMRKAQKTFVKRLLIGVAFFLLPVLVNIIMWLANVVWNGAYTTCGL